MPDRTFGRTVRYRRTKLGLSQAKLGELVGRSASTIRSWERDKSAPTETGVLRALAAILGVDEKLLFEKAGQELPPHDETSPTVEEALASLQSTDESEFSEEVDDQADADLVEPVDTGDPTTETLFESEERDNQDTVPEPEVVPEPKPVKDPMSVGTRDDGKAGYVKPPEPYVVTPTTPPFVEPSYMEDANQRQLYRVRNLATLVVAVALVIALLWATSESLAALGSWWDDFFGNLRL
jgi:transcriptional regulator with XRE-family HTH domain